MIISVNIIIGSNSATADWNINITWKIKKNILECSGHIIMEINKMESNKNVSWRLVMYKMFCFYFVLERMKHRFNASSLMSERGQKEVEALYALLTFLMEV